MSSPSSDPHSQFLASLQQAVGLHQQGRLAEAEGLYREVLTAAPDQFDALQLLGAIKVQQRQFAEGAELIARAIRINPNSPRALLNLGFAQLGLDHAADAAASFAQAIALNPAYPQALYGQGLSLARLALPREALACFDRALALKPDHGDALCQRGIALAALGQPADAVAAFDRALATAPTNLEALNGRGAALAGLGQFDRAIADFDRVLATAPASTEALNNRGNALRMLGRHDEALGAFDRALSLDPAYAEALYNRGLTLAGLGRNDAALAAYDAALALKPGFAEALNNRGGLLRDLKRLDEALASYDQALAIAPAHAEALNNRGIVLADMTRFVEAIASHDAALGVRPGYADAWWNRGHALARLRRFAEAVASYDRALAIEPVNAKAWTARGAALQAMRRLDAALESYDKALAADSAWADASYNRGNVLIEMNRLDEARASLEHALAVDPDHAFAFGGLADAALKACDWGRTAALLPEVAEHVARAKSIVSPFVLLGYSGDPALQLACASSFVADQVAMPDRPMFDGTFTEHDRLRITYLSADFRDHATAHLMAELFERHDRERFEIIGVSFGSDDASPMRSRLVKAFDRFHDVRLYSDVDAAQLVHSLETDIAIDLKGHTQESRPGILAWRPAPLQAGYLGYPGTIGADVLDYLIADRTVVPPNQQDFYSEKIVYLPHSYQVNDSSRRIGDRTPTRREAGLPDSSVVLCCFNNSWKITPPIFDVWMRLLAAIDGSVLWLLRDNAAAEANLRREAAARGIAADRLVFAGRVPIEEHLARHRLADLMLDTLPYNAHTTASDALWVGLPMVTCLGTAFAGRVGASLLAAAGLPELITHDLAAYEALALKLATDPAMLQAVRGRLAQNRATCPLFDIERSRRAIETAYLTMWRMWRRGEPRRGFAVDPSGV